MGGQKSSVWASSVIIVMGILTTVDSKVRVEPRENHLKVSLQMPSSTPDPGPHIADDTPRKVVAAVGTSAVLRCKTRSLGSKSVSWIRHRDLHVLTVGSFTFTTDARFKAHRDENTGDWILVLRNPEQSDSGLYECSIPTRPVIAVSINLNVVVPRVEVVGGSDVYFDRGSTVNITCMVHRSPVPPEFILWYHREKLVNYGQPGRTVSVESDHYGDTTRSSLLVYKATSWDSGTYSCQPSNAQTASINVHVLRSKTPAAMQTTTSTSNILFPSTFSLLSFLLLSTLLHTSLLPSTSLQNV